MTSYEAERCLVHIAKQIIKTFADEEEKQVLTKRELLIKDEKIRKAVRAWAEANGVPNNVKLNVFEYLGSAVTVIRYLYKAKTLPYERSVQFEYISSDKIYNSQNNRDCTITELCGEEE